MSMLELIKEIVLNPLGDVKKYEYQLVRPLPLFQSLFNNVFFWLTLTKRVFASLLDSLKMSRISCYREN